MHEAHYAAFVSAFLLSLLEEDESYVLQEHIPNLIVSLRICDKIRQCNRPEDPHQAHFSNVEIAVKEKTEYYFTLKRLGSEE